MKTLLIAGRDVLLLSILLYASFTNAQAKPTYIVEGLVDSIEYVIDGTGSGERSRTAVVVLADPLYGDAAAIDPGRQCPDGIRILGDKKPHGGFVGGLDVQKSALSLVLSAKATASVLKISYKRRSRACVMTRVLLN